MLALGPLSFSISMPPVKRSQLRALRPYLVGESARGDGEWDMHCPLHEDGKRSAQINVEKGVWYCHAGCGGGPVSSLIRQREQWVSPEAAARNGGGGGSGSGSGSAKRSKPAEEITEGMVAGWHSALMTDDDRLEALMSRRGLDADTLERFEVGWDRAQNAYTIPVRGFDGEILNIRRYQLDPVGSRRKIWSVEGMGEPRLYPASILDSDPEEVIVCEGEWDALLLIQNGFTAITRTGAAKVWKVEWGAYFKDKLVYVCHDRDHAGRDGNLKVARGLDHIAAEVREVELPYEMKPKHGLDVTDYLHEDRHGPADFQELLENAHRLTGGEEPIEVEPDAGSVIDAFDSGRTGKPMKLTVTIKGKRDPGYTVPREITLTCTRDAGQKCNVCPMYPAGGEAKVTIKPDSPTILEMMDSTKPQLHEITRRHFGAQKCGKLMSEVETHQSVEVLFARPSVDHSAGTSDAADYKTIKLTSVGRHDTMPNNTVEVVGALHPDPRRQLNEFLAWDLRRLETSLDRFEPSPADVKLLKRFQPRRRQRPLKKLGEISRAMSEHVTHIYGRPEMHALMDLVLHSVLSFNFNGKRMTRGWLEGLVIGDTRTGKSEAANKLLEHYGAGEMINCESASFAGVVGGLQQYGSTKEWSVTWGAIPLNDRRAVVLDEVSGLDPEEIGQMSDVRSSGLAKLTKIVQEVAFARTRLLWLGNPRNARMRDFTYGVQAINPLIGNAEDVARFDIAMSLAAGEVPLSQINAEHAQSSTKYTAEACHAVLRWAWSRRPEQVEWAEGAEARVRELASDMAARYTEDPPLVQGANVREKIARVAVAMAARLYSTRDGETVWVSKEHVEDSVTFLDMLYGMRGFGYLERSAEAIKDANEAWERRGDVKLYLYNKKGLAKFLRGAGKFRRQDLEEIMDIGRDEANAIISTLWEARMVRKVKGDIVVEPQLHELLREVRS